MDGIKLVDVVIPTCAHAIAQFTSLALTALIVNALVPVFLSVILAWVLSEAQTIPVT